MSNVIRAYIFPSFQIVGVIGIAFCSLWFSGWYGQAEESYISSFNAENENHINNVSVLDVTLDSALSFSEPIPYIALSLIMGLIGGFGGFYNQSKINQYDDLEAKYRQEKSEHGDTQKNYFEAIGYIIKSIFVSTDDRFDESCRVTIYRHTNDSHLQRIFRHASQSRFETGGRLRIPDTEGIVGAAWHNDGVAHISLAHNFGTKAYELQLEKELATHGAILPSSRTRMKTKDYFAMAVRNFDGKKMAVIVLESTITSKFETDRLKSIIFRENGDLAKYILHKGKLDEILNPDGDLDNA